MYRLMELVEHGDLLGVLEYLRTVGVSNKKVCDLSGVHFTTVHHYKKGKFELGEDKKEKILDTVRRVYLYG